MSERAGPALDAYLAGVDAEATPTVRALDRAIRSAHPEFAVAVKYNILMYAIEGDWRHWVVSIDAHPKAAIGLRFLYGVLLDDPRQVLRAGTSVLSTWDIARGGPIDEQAVAGYVREAVAGYPQYRANATAIVAASRNARPRGRAARPSSGRA